MTDGVKPAPDQLGEGDSPEHPCSGDDHEIRALCAEVKREFPHANHQAMEAAISEALNEASSKNRDTVLARIRRKLRRGWKTWD